MQAFAVEMVITAILMGVILALTDDGNGVPRGARCAALLIGLLIGPLIAVIGASMGPLTGFAMNPARDIGTEAFARLAGWGNVASPAAKIFLISGAAVRTGGRRGAGRIQLPQIIGRHLPCDTCVEEEKESASSASQQKASL